MDCFESPARRQYGVEATLSEEPTSSIANAVNTFRVDDNTDMTISARNMKGLARVFTALDLTKLTLLDRYTKEPGFVRCGEIVLPRQHDLTILRRIKPHKIFAGQ